MVSELLGSFSDNELSPECLDGAQAFLHGTSTRALAPLLLCHSVLTPLVATTENGISIPSAYTSYVAPIMSSKLWNDVKAHESLKHFETPYVVRLHNIYAIAPSEPCFTFTHPKFHARIDNRRATDMAFTARASAVVHGFAGYFDAVLYDDVTLSINPQTHSDGMFSWFPIYFPLRTPVAVAKDERLNVHFWRLVANHRVWYEWALSTDGSGGGVAYQSPIHNANGRSYWIGL